MFSATNLEIVEPLQHGRVREGFFDSEGELVAYQLPEPITVTLCFFENVVNALNFALMVSMTEARRVQKKAREAAPVDERQR